jgi:hypothetical protein
MSTSVLHSPQHIGAAIGATLASWGRALWSALEVQGQRRANIELRAMAARYEVTDPALSRKLRAALAVPRA